MIRTIKARLATANILFSILLLSVTIFLALNIYLPRYERSQGLIAIDDISNLIIKAAGQQAIERGVTNGGMSQAHKKGRADNSLLNKIKQRRSLGDKAMLAAFSKAQALTEVDWLPASFNRQLAASQQQWQMFLELRRQADQVLHSGKGSLSNNQWVNGATAMILANASLRQAAFQPVSNGATASYNNQVIKQAAWLAAEYSGRERALMAGAIGSGQPMSAETRERLLGFRAIVENQMRVLGQYAQATAQRDPGYADAWRQVEQEFLGGYQVLRQTLHKSAISGHYSITVASWLEHSTAAINTLLTLGEAASHSAIEAVQQDVASSQRALFISCGLIAFVALLAIGLSLLVTGIVRRLNMLAETITEIESGNNLTLRLQDHNHDELSRIGRALNSMFERFHDDLHHLRDISEQVSASAQQLASRSSTSRTHMDQQYSEIQTVATAMEQMLIAVDEVAQATTQTAVLTGEAEQHAVDSQSVLNSSLDTINNVATEVSSSGEFIKKLEKQTEDITTILQVINGIAEQTNLLALNAAIEAARAGDQGRGFAVVADEVRALAHNTQQSTESIETMIHTLQNSANQAVQAMERSTGEASVGVEKSQKASATLEDIARLMSEINQMSSRIASSAEQQSSSTGEITGSINNINSLAQQNSDGVAEAEGASRSLRDLAERMNGMVGKFQL